MHYLIFKMQERLNGRADIRSIASNKVLERCGFIKEGTIRLGKKVSVYCDYNICGMLREDYVMHIVRMIMCSSMKMDYCIIRIIRRMHLESW